jgi:putative ABC transport system permease protein
MNIIQDIRFGLRVLAKSPGFTLVAVLALALGIGVNSMMFTIYNAALLRSLPFVEPARVMHIHNRNVLDGRNNMETSYRELLAYRQQAHSFSSLAAFGDDEFTISDDRSTPDRIYGASVTSNLFSLLGQKPALGRDFQSEDEQAQGDPVAIISHALWQTRYGGDASIIGKSVKLDGRYFRLVGVMSQGMRFPAVHDIWIPIRNDFSERQLGAFMFRMAGRLRESVSLQQAGTELSAIAQRLQADHPETNKGIEPVVQSYLDFEISPGERLIMTVMMGAVSFVLLIACANVANLLLSRGASHA